jgi:protein gp37
MMDDRLGRVKWGTGEDRSLTSASNWAQPLKWDRAASAAGRIDTVFCLSLGDIWDNEVDPLWRRRAFDLMDKTPNLLWLLLSKRIGNAIKMCDPSTGERPLPRNAALGSTMVNQAEWNRDAPKLRHAGKTLGVRFTFASIEPMLGTMDVRENTPDWVIVGGESGSHARPMHPDWPRAIRDQCAAAGVPFFFKQWGEWAPIDDYPSETVESYDVQGKTEDGVVRVGKRAAGRLLDGVEHNASPLSCGDEGRFWEVRGCGSPIGA